MTRDLRARTVHRAELSPVFARAMFAIYEAYYDATDYGLFLRDLDGKDHVVVLEDGAGTLRGFSTVSVGEAIHAGRRIRFIYSGDTIVERAYWGQRALPAEWCRLAGRIKAAALATPLYWLLIVKGHRTYRLMTLFSKAHYPSMRGPTPPAAQVLMDHLGQLKFGSAYDPATGLIRFESSLGQLKPCWGAEESALKITDDVHFFITRNPGYLNGDEMLCLTELSVENMTSVARRGFEAGLARGPLALMEDPRETLRRVAIGGAGAGAT